MIKNIKQISVDKQFHDTQSTYLKPSKVMMLNSVPAMERIEPAIVRPFKGAANEGGSSKRALMSCE